MATVERSRSKRHATPEPTKRRKRKSHAFRNTFLVLLVLLLAVAYFAPTIIAMTPLRNVLLQTAVAPHGTITVESASLGWFSPIAAEKLELRDTTGDVVVAVKSFKSEKQLIALLLDMGHFGELYVGGPAVHLVAHEEDTNLEQVLAPLLNSEGESSVTARLIVTEGSIVIDDAVNERKYRIENLAVDCALGEAAQGLALAASGALPAEKQPADFKLSLQAGGSAAAPGSYAHGKVECKTTALPLEMLQPVLRRVVDGARLSGRLSADLGGAWGDMAKGSETTVSGQVLATDLAFAATALGPDEIRLARVEVPCKIVERGEIVDIEQLGLKCELGELAVKGSAKLSDFSAADKIAALARENYEVKGHIDLAQLARMLPATLQIREGTEITQGNVALVATARQQQSGMSWTGRVDASRLAAKAQGRPVAWENPLSIQFAVHETANGINIDRAVCTSSFLQINAAGSFDNLSASADFDLAQLVSELRQFSDLNDVQLAGKGHARLALKRAAADRLTADAEFQARGFQWITKQSRPWTEDNLVARLSLTGQLDGHALQRVEQAGVTVDSGGDHLEAKLRQAIDSPATSAWPIECSWRGQLAAWTPRLESCLGLSGWELAGAGTLQAVLAASSTAVTIENSKLDFAPLQVTGHGWYVNEPAVSTTVQGKWDGTAHRVDLTAAKLAAGTTLAAADRAVLRSASAGWVLDGGNVHVEAPLAQLAAWRRDPRAPAGWQISGQLTGDARVKHEGDATTAALDAAVDQLQIVDLSRPGKRGAQPTAWQERRLTLAARGDYGHTSEQLKLEKLQVASDALRCDAAGAIATSQRGGQVDLKGSLAYDWEKLAPLWKPYLGKNFQIAGRETREFAVNGQLSGPPTSADSWKLVRGEAAVGWTGMNAYGLLVGKGEIAPRLADGQITTRPIDFEVSQGRLTILPVARLSPSPAEMLLSKGPLLTNVQLSPEVCKQGLRFITPLLADATVAQGKFSVTLEGGRIPLVDPGAADLGGSIAILGQAKPGPIANEFVGLINELVTILQRGNLPNLKGLDGSLLSIDSPNVEFRMVNRRVYHRGLTLKFGTIPITTQGSVGLDDTLSLVAEVPLKAQLLGADLALGTLEGQTLKFPIEGTLQKPKLDKKALLNLPAQLLENTARDVLRNGLNKGLDRLFPAQK